MAQLLLDTEPAKELTAPQDDEELGRVLAELQVRATQNASSHAALTAESLRLKLARTEREITAAKGSDTGKLVKLVELRESLREQIERQVENSLEATRDPQD